MIQGKVALILIFVFGIVLLLVAIANYKPVTDSNSMSFFREKWGKQGPRLALVIAALLVFGMGYYLYTTKKLEQSPKQDEIIFQF
jgi:formate hydrogenlyase subunit 3/multisubunit Na+/H+ antiporter MnhD subunit